MSAPDSSSALAPPVTGARAMFTRRRTLLVVACALAVAVAGCATAPPGTTPATPSTPTTPAAPPRAEPPPPPVNLQGFPLAYRQGFGDGCATARGTERKDNTRFGNDGNYRVGWQDGVAQCKVR